MNEKNPYEFEYEIRKDIAPSELLLPSDNWRTKPDKKPEDLAKSIARMGLLNTPIVALYKNKNTHGKKGVVIDGNRRVFACNLLEGGHKTKIDRVPVTLHLPKNWRVSVVNVFAEDLTEEDIKSIRLHSTEKHLHFNKNELKTQFTYVAEEWNYKVVPP